jgi:hypothetical protein
MTPSVDPVAGGADVSVGIIEVTMSITVGRVAAPPESEIWFTSLVLVALAPVATHTIRRRPRRMQREDIPMPILPALLPKRLLSNSLALMFAQPFQGTGNPGKKQERNVKCRKKRM